MDFALLEGKNPEIAWSKIVSNSKKVRKFQSLKAPIRPLKFKLDFSKIKKNPLGKIFSEIAWLTFFLCSLAQGYIFLTGSSYWNISDVRIIGVNMLSEEKIIRLIASIKGQNIFKLDLYLLAQRLNKEPWIHKVSVKRELPSTILLNIDERSPMARIQLDKVYILDSFGVLLEEDSFRFHDLPLIIGINESREIPGERVSYKKLGPSLKMMHYLNQLEFFKNDPINEVKIKDLNRAVFTTKNNKVQIRMILENLKETFENFKVVLSFDDFKKTSYEYIDLSFRNQVVVKPVLSGYKKYHRS